MHLLFRAKVGRWQLLGVHSKIASPLATPTVEYDCGRGIAAYEQENDQLGVDVCSRAPAFEAGARDRDMVERVPIGLRGGG